MFQTKAMFVRGIWFLCGIALTMEYFGISSYAKEEKEELLPGRRLSESIPQLVLDYPRQQNGLALQEIPRGLGENSLQGMIPSKLGTISGGKCQTKIACDDCAVDPECAWDALELPTEIGVLSIITEFPELPELYLANGFDAFLDNDGGIPTDLGCCQGLLDIPIGTSIAEQAKIPVLVGDGSIPTELGSLQLLPEFLPLAAPNAAPLLQSDEIGLLTRLVEIPTMEPTFSFIPTVLGGLNNLFEIDGSFFTTVTPDESIELALEGGLPTELGDITILTMLGNLQALIYWGDDNDCDGECQASEGEVCVLKKKKSTPTSNRVGEYRTAPTGNRNLRGITDDALEAQFTKGSITEQCQEYKTGSCRSKTDTVCPKQENDPTPPPRKCSDISECDECANDKYGRCAWVEDGGQTVYHRRLGRNPQTGKSTVGTFRSNSTVVTRVTNGESQGGKVNVFLVDRLFTPTELKVTCKSDGKCKPRDEVVASTGPIDDRECGEADTCRKCSQRKGCSWYQKSGNPDEQIYEDISQCLPDTECGSTKGTQFGSCSSSEDACPSPRLDCGEADTCGKCSQQKGCSWYQRSGNPDGQIYEDISQCLPDTECGSTKGTQFGSCTTNRGSCPALDIECSELDDCNNCTNRRKCGWLDDSKKCVSKTACDSEPIMCMKKSKECPVIPELDECENYSSCSECTIAKKSCRFLLSSDGSGSCVHKTRCSEDPETGICLRNERFCPAEDCSQFVGCRDCLVQGCSWDETVGKCQRNCPTGSSGCSDIAGSEREVQRRRLPHLTTFDGDQFIYSLQSNLNRKKEASVVCQTLEVVVPDMDCPEYQGKCSQCLENGCSWNQADGTCSSKCEANLPEGTRCGDLVGALFAKDKESGNSTKGWGNSNPIYEGATFEGDNPLFNDGGWLRARVLASTGDESRSLISTIRGAIRREKLGDGQLPNFSPRRDSKAVCAALNLYDKNEKKCSKAGRKGGCERCRTTDLDPPTPTMAPILLPSGPNIEPESRQCNWVPGPRTTFAPKASLDSPSGGGGSCTASTLSSRCSSSEDKNFGQCNDCSTPNPAPVEAPILPL